MVQTIYKTYEHALSAPKGKGNLRYINWSRKELEVIKFLPKTYI
jgi:hypothetical protein